MHWKQISVSPETPIIGALEIIDNGSAQIALVVDKNGLLLGTVTDGDVRRGILSGVSLDAPVKSVMNTKPIVTRSNESHEKLLNQMRTQEILQLPIVDKNGKLVGVRFLKDLINRQSDKRHVILMAGGFGKRLSPLTDDCPKPMLKIGGKPILESLINNLAEHGFNRFTLAVHYQADVIQSYFEDGSRFGVEIDYVHETEPLGTAGALSLLSFVPSRAFLVMNCDLVTNIDFKKLLHFHESQEASATMCVQLQSFQIPFGIVQLDNQQVIEIEEKPIKNYFASAGIYVLEPSLLQSIPYKKHMDMPDLLQKIIVKGGKVNAFALREDWLDIGRLEDFKRAQTSFAVTDLNSNTFSNAQSFSP